MKKRERLKRPVPERKGPIRSWPSLLAATAGAGAPVSSGGAAAAPGGAPQSAVRRGVDLGYKVFEEYLRQGQTFARSVSPAGGAFAGPGGAAGAAAIADLPALTNRMFRYASDFASVWMEAMGTMVGGAAAAAPSRGAPPAARPPSPSPSPPTSSEAAPRAPAARAGVALRIDSSRAAEASVALDVEAAGGRLEVAALQARRGGGRVGPVTVKRGAPGGRVAFHVRVPAGAAKGTYFGAIVDGDTGQAVGQLTVRIPRVSGAGVTPPAPEPEREGGPDSRESRDGRESRDRIVPALLDEYGAIVRRKLGEYLSARAGDDVAHLYDLVRDYPSRGGRTLRSTLCIATARAFGASIDDALRSAVALEILHNAFLVHDDIEDASEERRGSPTLHALHGVPIAINVGDAMTVLSLRPLIDNHRALGWRRSLAIFEEVEAMARDTVEGQALELAWRRDNTVDLEEADYLRLILKKTCAYSTIFPLRVGAIIGAADDGPDALEHAQAQTADGRLARLSRFGFFVGAAFQIEDDLLNLVGDKRAYGKELDGDIREGKRTLMLVRLLGLATPAERARLQSFLARPRAEKDDGDVRWVRERMDRYGCLAYAREVAHGLAGAARHEFHAAFAGVPASRDRAFLEALPAWVLERS